MNESCRCTSEVLRDERVVEELVAFEGASGRGGALAAIAADGGRLCRDEREAELQML